VLCGNLGEGLALTGCTTYLSLQCKALASGHLFGIFFIFEGVQEMQYAILDMKYQTANNTIYYWLLAVMIISSFLWLLMDRERTHHLEEEWHLEEIRW
jgi:hypothetical protein